MVPGPGLVVEHGQQVTVIGEPIESKPLPLA